MGFFNKIKNIGKKVGGGIAKAAKTVGQGIAHVATDVYKDVIKPGAKLAGHAWDKAAPYIAKYGEKAAAILAATPGLEEFAPIAEAVTKGAQGYEGGKEAAKAWRDKNPIEAAKALQKVAGATGLFKK